MENTRLISAVGFDGEKVRFLADSGNIAGNESGNKAVQSAK
jgi:hypothetical protein